MLLIDYWLWQYHVNWTILCSLWPTSSQPLWMNTMKHCSCYFITHKQGGSKSNPVIFSSSHLFDVLMSTGSSPVCTSTLMVAFTSPAFRMLAATFAACSVFSLTPSAPDPTRARGAPAASPLSSFTLLPSMSPRDPARAAWSLSRARFWLRVWRTASSDMAALTLEREKTATVTNNLNTFTGHRVQVWAIPHRPKCCHSRTTQNYYLQSMSYTCEQRWFPWGNFQAEFYFSWFIQLAHFTVKISALHYCAGFFEWLIPL